MTSLSSDKRSSHETYNKVYVWGLNDKDQLGGIKGSKLKAPALCKNLSRLSIKQILGGSKSLFALTTNGKVRLFL